MPRTAIATPHYLASLAGAHVLADGGNAIDAAVAANLALAVVAPYYCGFGGDLFAIVWDGAAHGYRSAGRAPAASSAEALLASGLTHMPLAGPHTVTVPGAVQGWFDLLARFGTRSFGALAAHARALAEDGFVLTRAGAYRLDGAVTIAGHLGVDTRDLRAAYPERTAGARVRQAALARTIDALAADGPAAFYDGPIGAAIAGTVADHGGALTPTDLAAHAAEWVTPLRAAFAGRTVLELPPPTQGVTALEMLRLAQTCRIGDDGPDRVHLLVEIAKLALADRDAWVGDPDHMSLPAARLVGDEWVAARRAEIDAAQARAAEPRRLADGGTAYLCCADADGLMVSLIQSNFTAIGSGLHVRDWGINLHNRGSSFTLERAHVNVLAPRRLPMHTLIPGLVLDGGGAPTHVFGTMGGHAQASVHLQMLVRMLVDGDDPQVAIDTPRWHADPVSGQLQVENRFPREWREDLARRGHALRELRAYDDGVGHAHCIAPLRHGYAVACDPRAESAALGT